MATPKQFRRRGRLALILAVVVGALAVTGGTLAAVWTDQSDYSPGSVVTISGDNSGGGQFQPGETVDVNATNTNTGWAGSCSATADNTDNAAWSCQLTLSSDPSLAGGSYTYTATGESSGYSEGGTFTDTAAAHVDFATTGLPASTSVTVTGIDYYNNGGHHNTNQSVTFSSPGYPTDNTASLGVDPSSNFAFTFPSTVAGCTLTNQTSSPITTPGAGNRTTVTGNYSCPVQTAPVVKTAAADANGTEGNLLSTSGAFSDSDGDTLTLTADNTLGTFTDNGDGTWTWSYQTTAPVPSGTITVTADDGHGHTVTDSFDYSATNVAPTVALTSPATTANEGDTVTYNFTITDPGTTETYGFASGYPKCGANGTVSGTPSITGKAGTFDCSFPSAPASSTVAVKVNDGTADGNEDSATVTIVNVPPSVAYDSPPTTANEGDTKTFNFTITDPGTTETYSFVSGYPDCGTGGSVSGTPSITGKSGTFECYFDDGPASPNVKVEVNDGTDNSDPAAQSVTVANVPPDGTFNTPAADVNEGSSFALSFSGVTDPSKADTTAGFQYRFDCGTGYGSWGSTDNVTCDTAVDGPNTLDVHGQVKDKDGGTSTHDGTVTVDNVNPSVGTITLTPSNCSVSLSVSFTDPGVLDTHTATIDWGDGHTTAGTVTESGGSGTVTGSHLYAGPGNYTIKVKVTDKDGGVDTNQIGLNNNPAVSGNQPPIMPGKTFNTGSTIPVKVIVTGCTSGLAPTVMYQALSSVTPVTPNPAGKSSKVAGQMRYDSSLPGFIYNWQTKGVSAGYYEVFFTGLPGAADPFAVVQLVK